MGEKDAERSLVPTMGLTAKLSKAEVETNIETPAVTLELPSPDVNLNENDGDRKSSFGFGSKRDKKKKSKGETEPKADVDASIKIDATSAEVDGSGVMKNWYKEKSKSPDKKKSGGLSLGFGSKGKETIDIDAKTAELDVPQEVKIKKKGSFLGGLIKKGSKAKDVQDISLKYKGKLKDNEGSEVDVALKANVEA